MNGLDPISASKKEGTHSGSNEPAMRSPVETIQQIYLSRKEKNPHYSLNAFARDIGVNPAHLSRIFTGTRPLTLKQGMNIAATLQFTQAETNLFVLGIIGTASPNAKISKAVREGIMNAAAEIHSQALAKTHAPIFIDLMIERFKTIAQWYHLAILNLTFTNDFESKPQWIAERLNITSAEARDAVDRLLELGFLTKSPEGKLEKTEANLYIKTERSERAMRTYQGQMIEKAKEQLQKTSEEDFAKRLINSITFACSPNDIPLLQKKINEFQREILAKTKTSSHEEVYQMNCQLFPLTEPIKNKRRSTE